MFLCLPGKVGAVVSGYFSGHCPSLSPPLDAWPGLYIFQSCLLETQAFILENYKCRGLGGEAWGPRTGVKRRNSGSEYEYDDSETRVKGGAKGNK